MNTYGFKVYQNRRIKHSPRYSSSFLLERKREDRRRIRQRTINLALAGALLHGTSLTLLGFTVQELALLISAQATQDALTLFLLNFLGGDAALLSLLFFLDTAELLNLLLADVAYLAHHLATEMGGGNELISEAKELVEQREGVGVARSGGGEVSRELNALLGDGLLDPEKVLDKKSMSGQRATYFMGLSTGWSVTIRNSKSLPACSIAWINSGVRSVSLISAFSVMTVTHEGSLGLSLEKVIEAS